MTCGIYQIRNIYNGKVYIGSSNNIESRISGHINHLEKEKHHSIHLQRAWNKYGYEFFDVDILEECEEAELLMREQFYLDDIKPFDYTKGYNISLDAVAPTRGRKINFTEEGKIVQRTRMIGNTNTLGYHHTEEAKEKIRKAHTGRKSTEHQIQCTIDSHKKLWEVSLVSPEGIIYSNIDNLAAFCKEHGMNYHQTMKLCKDDALSSRGWTKVDSTRKKKKRSDFGGHQKKKNSGYRYNRAKTFYNLLSPEGELFPVIAHLPSFCKNKEISYKGIYSILSKKKKIYKGWTCL